MSAFIIKIKPPSAFFTVIISVVFYMYYSCYICLFLHAIQNKGANRHDPRLDKMSKAYIKIAYHAVTIINKLHESQIQCAQKCNRLKNAKHLI